MLGVRGQCSILFLLGASLNSAEDLEESININEAFETSVAIGSHAFAKMEGDVDRNKKKQAKRPPEDLLEQHQKLEHKKR